MLYLLFSYHFIFVDVINRYTHIFDDNGDFIVMTLWDLHVDASIFIIFTVGEQRLRQSWQANEYPGATSWLAPNTVLLCTRSHRPTWPCTAHQIQRSDAYTVLGTSSIGIMILVKFHCLIPVFSYFIIVVLALEADGTSVILSAIFVAVGSTVVYVNPA